MKIKTLIIDDEPHALAVIQKYIIEFPQLELVGTCGNAVHAFRVLQEQEIDLIFLDIKMPGLLGTDMVRTLKNPPKVIFTTAYQDYALDGFDLNAVDYLLKPIPFDRFLKAMNKVFEFFKLQHQKPVPALPSFDQHHQDFLYLRIDRKTVKINVNDICWMESLKDYIRFTLKDRVLVTKQKIGVLEELLPQEKFIRIHRSFIVAIEKIDSYHSYAIEIHGKELPIGRNYKAACKKRLVMGN